MAKCKKKRRKASAFYDLNISTDGLSPAERSSLITTALRLGFSGIALNHVLKAPLSDSHSCKPRAIDLSNIVSPGSELSQSAHFHLDILNVPAGRRPFRQYERLTLVVDTAIQAAALNTTSTVLRSYDLVAVRPTSQKVFDQACSHLEVDIISLDFLHRLPIRLKAPLVQAALERGVVFEVTFSGAFQDLKARRELFANAQALTRGRNIIITSGARRAMELRGPNDVANIGTMFGLSREAAKMSVSKNCEPIPPITKRDVILRGLMRKKMYKSAIMVEKIPAWEQQPVSNGDTWFDVPRAWDPLSNVQAGDAFSLPEKEDNRAAIRIESYEAQAMEGQDVQRGTLDDGEGPSMSLAVKSDDKEEGFLSIDFSGLQNAPFLGAPKKCTGEEVTREKPKGKQRKRIRR